jgi:TonB family protein
MKTAGCRALLATVFSTAICFAVPLSAFAQEGPLTVFKTIEAVMTHVTKWVEPNFPPIARAANAGGAVVVEIIIGETGKVESARIVSGHPLLQAGVLQAARAWEFEPFVENGKPVRVLAQINYDFPEPPKPKEKTLAQLERDVRRRPRSAVGHHRLGEFYFKALRYDDAIKHFKIAVRLNPRFVDAFLKLGFSFNRINEFEKALDAFNEAVRLDPMRSEALHVRGLTRMSLHRYNEAISDLKKSLELEGPITFSYFMIGKCYVLLGQPEDAISFYEAGLAKYDNDLGHYGLGEAYFELERFESAIDHFKRALDLSEGPGKAITRYQLGRSYLWVGDKDSAIKEYEALREMNSSLADLLLEEIKQHATLQGRSKG